MHAQNFAAIWDYPLHWPWHVNYVAHMQRVQGADLVFMFRRKLGIIGVGQATGPMQKPLLPGDPHRIRGAGWNALEYRVQVKWIRWQPDNPCRGFGSPWAFYNVTDRPRLAAVLAHFGLNAG
jgi:hypothetical protein